MSNTAWGLTYVADATTRTNLWSLLLTTLVICVFYDQAKYMWSRRGIVGATFKLPFIGSLGQTNPSFQEYYAKWNSGPLSCVSILHKFVVIVSDRDMARKVFNSPSYVRPALTSIAPKLLGPDNWFFLDGKRHDEVRKGLNPLLTRQALAKYLPRQGTVYDNYFKKMVRVTKDNGGNPVPFVDLFREIACAASCRTFVGDYIPDEAVKKVSKAFVRIAAAMDLISLPFVLPYTRAWDGKKAADELLLEFSRCVAESKARMATGCEVACVMDAWILQMLKSDRWRSAQEHGQSTGGLEKPVPLIAMLQNHQIAQTFLGLLFAAQDTTSSAVTWLFQVIAQRTDVLHRIRGETLTALGDDTSTTLSINHLESLTYTTAVVRELLRHRPPAIVFPYQAKKPFPINETYTVPKGAMIVPTIYMALHDPHVYENADNFDPERYYSGDAEEKGAKNYLVFGTGPHSCPGQNYVQINLALLIGRASIFLEWRHHATALSEEIEITASIFPKDGCLLTFEERRW